MVAVSMVNAELPTSYSTHFFSKLVIFIVIRLLLVSFSASTPDIRSSFASCKKPRVQQDTGTIMHQQQVGVLLQPQLQLQPQPQPWLLQLLFPQSLLPQQHQMMISRMMIQQQLPPPKPLLHIQRPPKRCRSISSTSFHPMRLHQFGAFLFSHYIRRLVTIACAARQASYVNTPFSCNRSLRVRTPSGK